MSRAAWGASLSPWVYPVREGVLDTRTRCAGDRRTYSALRDKSGVTSSSSVVVVECYARRSGEKMLFSTLPCHSCGTGLNFFRTFPITSDFDPGGYDPGGYRTHGRIANATCKTFFRTSHEVSPCKFMSYESLRCLFWTIAFRGVSSFFNDYTATDKHTIGPALGNSNEEYGVVVDCSFFHVWIPTREASPTLYLKAKYMCTFREWKRFQRAFPM